MSVQHKPDIYFKNYHENALTEFLKAYEKFVYKYGKKYVNGTLEYLKEELKESEQWRSV